MSTYSKIVAAVSAFNILFCVYEMGRMSAGAPMSLLSAIIIATISVFTMADAFKTPSE
jgi:hypothetical protein